MIKKVEHVLTPFTRRREVSKEKGKFLFELYKLLRRAPSSMSKDSRQRTFEAAAVGDYHWEVVAISENALEELHKAKGKAKVQRGHAYSRDDRFMQLFGPEAKDVSQKQLLDFFYEHDVTALITKEENAKDEPWSPLHAVDPDKDLFSAAGYRVKLRVKTELKWVSDLQVTLLAKGDRKLSM